MIFLPALMSGLGTALGAIGGKKRSESEGTANLQDRYRYDVLNQQAFNPMQPYRNLKKGALYAAFARAWGLDKILGNDFLEHISDRGSHPGTDAIGGAKYPTGPPDYIPEGERKGGALGALAGILGGAGQAIGGLYPSGGDNVGFKSPYVDDLMNKPPWG